MFEKVLPSVTAYKLPLIGLNELRKLDRWNLEDRARALSQAIPLGDGVMLCRILGRYKLYVPSSDVGFGAHVMMEGIWEGWLTTFVARRIKPGMTAVDVGANHGYYTMFFADLVETRGRVVAVEPHPRTSALLRQSVAVNGFDGRVKVLTAAAVARDGEDLTFYADPAEPKNARIIPDDTTLPQSHITKVKGMALDSVLADCDRVDFIKIDVEGAEENTLAGGMGIIARDKPDILLEFNVHRCKDPAGLLDKLEAIYGAIYVIDFHSALEVADRSVLMDKSRTEDWSLFLSTKP